MSQKIDQIFGVEPATPFVIAEMSGNHNQSFERALAIVDAAADSGAHGVKFQTYTAETMTIPAEHGLFAVTSKNSLWKGETLYSLYEKAHTPWVWHAALFKRACERGMIPFSSPFDSTAVDFLESLDCPIYKIASFENTDHPLLRKVAQTGKPVIMSTGLTTAADIDESVRVLREGGCEHLVLLKCTSTYPATPENTNIRTIPHMAELFQCPVGLSDHTMGIGAAVAATALGARVIEKHFTLSRAEGGVDSAFSLEPHELASLVVETRRAYESLGTVQYGVQEAEKNSRQFKRSIYVVKDVDPGEEFTTENIRVIRPGDGLEPKYYDHVLGRTSKVAIRAGTPLNPALY